MCTAWVRKAKVLIEHWVTLGRVLSLSLLLGFFFILTVSYIMLSVYREGGFEATLPYMIVMVASMTMLAAAGTLVLMRRSLDLTRSITRPFLNVSVPETILTQSTLELIICNTGNLPADKVEIFCTLCTIENEDVIREYELSTWNKAPSIYFPRDEVGPTYHWSPKDYNFADEGTREKTRIRVTIDYRNKLTEDAHTTVRAFIAKISKFQGQYLLVPIPKEDKWT